mmetsp:Transcript_11575/g.21380  ORF Transcript_11575/g.21380 Transcript_11575/m.21380 type:complete len:143 (+) Transcript_11575:127-555(+)
MASEAEAIEAAKNWVASAEKWVATAAQALESAKTQVSLSGKELKDAKEYLESMESKLQVVVVDSDDGNESLGGHHNGRTSTDAEETYDQDMDYEGDGRKRRSEQDDSIEPRRRAHSPENTNDLQEHMQITVKTFDDKKMYSV